jgi:KipI family sensor histidine kinase inhibitor
VSDGIAIEALGDQAWLVRFGDRIDSEINRRVHALARALQAAPPPGTRDIVPAYASLAVFVDADDAVAFEAARAHIEYALAVPSEPSAREPGRCIEITVRYGGSDGFDLDEVARLCRLTPDEVIARHTAAEYRVAMLGFAPGFPYLLGLDPGLAVPRLAEPRRQVPAGSVAIGGAQTGIYPRPGPGGWRVIGRAAEVLFDPQRVPASYLAPGDRVRFVALAAPA